MGKILWRRKWQPTLVFLSGKSHEQKSLASYSPWGCKRVRHDWATQRQQINVRQTDCTFSSLLLYSRFSLAICFIHSSVYMSIDWRFIIIEYKNVSQVGKESACNAEDLDLIPGLGRSPREGKGYPLQYSGLENSMDCIVHGVSKVGYNWMTFTSLHNDKN